MKSLQFKSGSISAVSLLLVTAWAPFAEPATITDLGTLGGFYNVSYAYAINSAGQIAGRSDVRDTVSPTNLNAFLYSGSAMNNLNIIGTALGLNAAGQVVGARFISAQTTNTHAFLSSGGTMTDLGTLSGGAFSTATGINSSGQVAGYSQLFTAASNGTSVHAFLYSAGAMKDLGTLNSGTTSYAYGINAGGQVVGVSDAVVRLGYPSATHAFLYSAGNMTDLGLISGVANSSTAGSSASAINDSGQIVGNSTVLGKGSHAFIYSGGVMTDLGTIPGGGGASYALAVNSTGQVVGYAHSNTTFSDHAFLSGNGVMTDLNLQLPPNSGWVLTSATGINDAGQIVGYGTTKTGQTHAFLLEGAVADPSKVQTITFAAPADVKLGAAPFDIDYLASSSYGLPVSFSSATPSVCTVTVTTPGIQQTVLSTVSGGTCSIVASQPGNANYLPATPVTQSFTVIGAPSTPQTLTFKALPDVTFGAAPFPIAGNASSGLLVMFSAAPAAVCTVGPSTAAGTMVTVTGGGTCAITASQVGGTQGAALRGPMGVRFLSGANALAPRAVFAAATPVTQTFTVNAATGGPAIKSAGIVPVYSSATTIQSGSWVSIYGTSLAAATATWSGDFPTALGGVSVTINGKKAYLWYVSPTQINLQVPDDTTSGNVNVTLTNAKGTWTSAVTLGPVSPSFSVLDGKHVTGIILRSNGSGTYGGGTYDIAGPTGTSLGYKTVAAKQGDSLVLFGVGFGPTNPAVPAGKIFAGAAATTSAVQTTVGGMPVIPAFSGLSSAGLYQINLTVPAGLGTGDVALLATVSGFQTQTGVVLSLQ